MDGQTSRTCRSRAKPTRQWVPSPGSMVAVRLLMRTMVPTTEAEANYYRQFASQVSTPA